VRDAQQGGHVRLEEREDQQQQRVDSQGYLRTDFVNRGKVQVIQTVKSQWLTLALMLLFCRALTSGVVAFCRPLR
jgi:hypothetical protein